MWPKIEEYHKRLHTEGRQVRRAALIVLLIGAYFAYLFFTEQADGYVHFRPNPDVNNRGIVMLRYSTQWDEHGKGAFTFDDLAIQNELEKGVRGLILHCTFTNDKTRADYGKRMPVEFLPAGARQDFIDITFEGVGPYHNRQSDLSCYFAYDYDHKQDS